MRNDARYEIKEVGVFTPKMYPQPRLNAGDVGYFIANIKSTADIKIGDTITDARNSAREPLPGFQEIHPMVFSGIYPINTGDFEHLKTAIGKLRLNDSAFIYTPESSVALGFGFRCGFLGLLHMEIIQERLRREYNMDIIATSPSVVYEIETTRGETILIDNPAHLPGSKSDRRNSGADRESLRPLSKREHRGHPPTHPGKTRANGPYRDARRAPGNVALRIAVERNSGRF